jgi:hypothetical protein
MLLESLADDLIREPLSETVSMESVHEPVASHPVFIARLSFNFIVASIIIGISLFAGMWGYHDLCELGWMDSFVNASMILSGMGPLASPTNDAGKIFAGCYALYSGLVLVLSSGLIIAPIAHRLLHRLHVQCD